MCRIILSVLALLCSVALGHAYEFGYPFNQYNYTARNTAECGSYFNDAFDKGSYKYSCSYVEIAHLQKSRGPIQKFGGVACGRGETKEQARFNALGHARDLVNQEKTDAIKAAGNSLDSGEYYVNNDSADYCVETTAMENTEKEATKKGTPWSEYKWPRWMYGPDDQPSNSSSAPAESRRPDQATFIIHNADRYTLGLEFFSETRRGYAWPGNNQQYNLRRDGTYNLNCQVGEKICFGAWRDNQTTSWGAGRNNGPCNHCCTVCGDTFETTLNDGGADSFPAQNTGNADSGWGTLGNVLSGVAGALGNLGGIRSVPNSPVPVPNRPAPPQNPSTITGR